MSQAMIGTYTPGQQVMCVLEPADYNSQHVSNLIIVRKAI